MIRRRVLLRDRVDYLKLGGRAWKKTLLSTVVIGSMSLGLWQKQEQIAVGQQRVVTYVSDPQHERPDVIVLAWIVLTSGTTFNRDALLPGWDTAANSVDCIAGGGGGPSGVSGAGGGGGGGGGFVRSQNLALPATVTYQIGAAGAVGGAGGHTYILGLMQANGGSAGGTPAGGAGGTPNLYNSVGRTGGTGGAGSTSAGGGGGGAAGIVGNGVNGQPASSGAGGAGGAGDAGSGGAGGTGGFTSPGVGNPGNEYAPGVGCGGGGGGAAATTGGATAANYGGGGGGGSYSGGARPGGPGAQGLIGFLYTPLPAPTVTLCSPNSGPTQGGYPVTITGTGFTNVTAVTFDGLAAANVVVVNTTTITCTVPLHYATGPINVSVFVSGGVPAGTGTNVFTYVAAVVSSCTPNKGPPSGGTPVTIGGSGFQNARSVTVGGVALSSLVVSNTSITGTTGAHAAGLVDVVVNFDGSITATGANLFTYVAPSAGFNMPMLGI